jgi:hypothetical protein
VQAIHDDDICFSEVFDIAGRRLKGMGVDPLWYQAVEVNNSVSDLLDHICQGSNGRDHPQWRRDATRRYDPPEHQQTVANHPAHCNSGSHRFLL